MAELKELEYRFSKKYQDVFEDIATLIFCTEIGLSKGVNKRVNQKAIESDPVSINEKIYAYQAKYYEASTKLLKPLFASPMKYLKKQKAFYHYWAIRKMIVLLILFHCWI